MKFFFYFVCSYIIGVLGAWVISRWADTFALIDISSHRSSHEGTIPKGAGIGILIAFVVSSIFVRISPYFWLSLTILSLISFLGDRKEISPKIRLPVQFTAAIIMLVFSSPSSYMVSSIFLIIFFALFIVATSNWYNFMDGINGIAGVTAVVGLGLLAFYAYFSHGDNRVIIVASCVISACLGFLPFNIPKARVFMGDVGSIFLGFLFAAFVIMLSKNFLDFICLSGFLFPFYADEFVTMAVRLKDRENLLKAHRRHFYQLLVNEMGITHWKVSTGYGLLQLIVGLSILCIKPFGVIPVISLLVFFFAVFIWVNYLVRTKLAVRYEVR